MKLNSNIFGFSFFLGGKTTVSTLEEGALQHGGATRKGNTIYSNVETDTNITINEAHNKLGIFIPSTIDVATQINSTIYVQETLNKLLESYTNINIVRDCKGSWYSDERKEVVYDDIVILEIEKDKVDVGDIKFFISLAENIKRKMKQEGVTITINEAMAIV